MCAVMPVRIAVGYRRDKCLVRKERMDGAEDEVLEKKALKMEGTAGRRNARKRYRIWERIKDRLLVKNIKMDKEVVQWVTGHGNFRKRLYDFKLVDSESCMECGEVETGDHAVWECREKEVNVRRMRKVSDRKGIMFGNWREMAYSSIYQVSSREVQEILRAREELHNRF